MLIELPQTPWLDFWWCTSKRGRGRNRRENGKEGKGEIKEKMRVKGWREKIKKDEKKEKITKRKRG